MADVPPAPVPAPPPQPPAPPPPTVGPRTYREYYLDAANDPWAGNYGALMRQYDAIPAVVPDALTLRMLSYGPSTPQAFIMLAAGPDPAAVGRVVMMHCPTRHPISIPEMDWDDMIMAFEGDVLGQTCTVVEWPAISHRLASNGAGLQVPTMANLDALFAANPQAIVVGPFAANEAGTETIRTRNVMAVPPKYIPIVLGQHLTPREAYTRLGGAIRDDGQEVNCANLLSFLRAACTIPTAGMVPTIQRPPV